MSKLKQSLRSVSRRIETVASVIAGKTPGGLAIERHGGFDVALRRGTTDERVIAHSFANDIFLSAMPDYIPRPADVILDIGAHIGTFSLLAASKVPEGRVFAVEAGQDTFNYLRINAAINKLQNLDVTHVALSDRAGTVHLSHDAAGAWGHSITARLSGSGEEVACQSLEAFMAEKQIDRVGFAKLNCEGAEFPILLGAPQSILERFDRMLILFHCDLAADYELSDLTAALEKAGLSLDVKTNKKQRGRILARRSR